jgi:hypothetical protein
MTMPGRAAVATALAALVLVAGGCGSSDKKDDTASFKQDYTAESAKLHTIGDDIGTAVTGAEKMTDAEVVTTFDALAGRAHASVDVLKGLEAPDLAKDEVATLARTVEKAAGDMDTIVTGAKTKDIPAVTDAAKALVVDSAPVKAALTALDTLVKGLKE